MKKVLRNQTVKVKETTILPILSCNICNGLVDDATVIDECLHLFCRDCIYDKITEEDMDHCPVCNVYLGAEPLQRLREDRSIKSIKKKLFPAKEDEVNASDDNVGSFKANETKKLPSPLFDLNCTPMEDDNDNPQDEVISKKLAEKSAKSWFSSEKGTKNDAEEIVSEERNLKMNENMDKANASENEEIMEFTAEEMKQSIETGIDEIYGKHEIDEHVSEPESIWFILEPSENQEGGPLPPLEKKYIKIKIRIPLNPNNPYYKNLFPHPSKVLTSALDIQNYLVKKLNLKSPDEVLISCLGKLAHPVMDIKQLAEYWFKQTYKVSAKDHIMVLNYSQTLPQYL